MRVLSNIHIFTLQVNLMALLLSKPKNKKAPADLLGLF